MAQVAIGDVVKICTEKREMVKGIVTQVWSETCINAVYVSPDESLVDSCGRQTVRITSLVHYSNVSDMSAPGRYWQLPA